MIQHQVGQRYAKALFEAAKDSANLDEVHSSLMLIEGLLEQSAELKGFLHNPLLENALREKILRALFQRKVPQLVENFLLLINRKNRLRYLADAIAAFDELYLTSHSRVRAVVQTALPLDETQRQKIVGKLSQKFGRNIAAEWQIRRDLLGGFRILAESKLYDYSFISQLEEFRQKSLH